VGHQEEGKEKGIRPANKHESGAKIKKETDEKLRGEWPKHFL